METIIHNINTNSLRSIFIEMMFNDLVLSSGTAFIAKTDDIHLLVTNRHNVTGRNNDSGEYLSKTGGIPNKIRMLVPLALPDTASEAVQFNSWQYFTVDLYQDEFFENPIWIEHPLREKVDVAGLVPPPVDKAILDLLSYDVSQGWYNSEIGELINVLGFPYGISAARFPIWVTGYIASEPTIDYGELPVFLIDCRTRQGQSGSPAIGRFMPGHIVEYQGKQYQAKKEMSRLLGIYSGRINAESDLGKVWKTQVIREIITGGIQVCMEQGIQK